MQSPLTIVFFGTPSFVVPIAKILNEHFKLVGVVTAPDTIQGRKKILTPSPVKQYAEEVGIPAFTYDKLDQHAEDDLAILNADLFVVAAYGVIIPQAILDLPRLGSLNIHPSLLPQYRGPSPIQTALLNGDTVSGITIIKMDEQVDHGPIVMQWEFPLQHTDTFEMLHVAMFEDAANRLPQIIDGYTEGKTKLIPQDEKSATFCDKITRESGYFSSHNPPSPEVLNRMIRAYYPWPNAWTKIKMRNNEEKILKFLPEKKVQLEGGKPMSMKDAINGYPELKDFISGLFDGNN